MKKNKHTLSALLAAAGIALLSGCSGSTESATAEIQQPYNTFYDSAGSVAKRSEELGVGAYEMEAMPQEAAVSGMDADNALTSTAPIQPVTANRKLIRTINMSAETTEFDNLLAEISQTVTNLGGYMEQSNVSGNSMYDSYSRNRYASLLVRIPADQVDSFVTQVRDRANITNTNESTEDVTLQYSDIESRKKSLAIEQERLWELMEKADTMEAIIVLESRLSEIRYQLESFESQLRTYDNQVDYSTIYLNLNEVPVLTPTAPDSVLTRIQKGFSRNLSNVSNGLVNFFVWLVSSSPTLLLLLAIVFIIIFILRKINKRTMRLKQKKAETAAGSSQNITSDQKE